MFRCLKLLRAQNSCIWIVLEIVGLLTGPNGRNRVGIEVGRLGIGRLNLDLCGDTADSTHKCLLTIIEIGSVLGIQNLDNG